MTVTCCETAALVIQVIIWVINLIKSGSSNFCKDLPLFHPVNKRLLPLAQELTLSCYHGDCSKCTNHSVMCHDGVLDNLRNYRIYPKYSDTLNVRTPSFFLKRHLFYVPYISGHVPFRVFLLSVNVRTPKTNPFFLIKLLFFTT